MGSFYDEASTGANGTDGVNNDTVYSTYDDDHYGGLYNTDGDHDYYSSSDFSDNPNASQFHNMTNHHYSYDYHGHDYHSKDEYDVYVYEAFGFERSIYLYIWEILVVVTVLVNIIVIYVLVQKKIRSVTNWILVAIAISDSLTGLVTLPTYIMVYQNLQLGDDGGGSDIHGGDYDYGNGTSYPDYHAYEYGDGYEDIADLNISYAGSIGGPNGESKDAYMLSKSLCEAFMISKFFLSKSFHTISIWLTMFLGIQRYVCVSYPFKTQKWFTTRNTIIICIVISLAAPVLHLFHLIDDKTVHGFCTFILRQTPGNTAHMWIVLFLRHLVPCTVLVITTVLFIRHLKKNSFVGNAKRGDENRRLSKLVIAIVVVFLIPEVPYGIFLLYLDVAKHIGDHSLVSLEHNRLVHAIYELVLVVSFHMNFYIYTFMNKRFRRELMKTFHCIDRMSRVWSMSSTRRTFAGTSSVSSTNGLKLKEMKKLNQSSETDSKITEMQTLNASTDSGSNEREDKLVLESQSDKQVQDNGLKDLHTGNGVKPT